MIYFVQCGTKRLVKIGYSKGLPHKRIKTLQTGSVDPLVLIGMLEGSPLDEAAWHRRFEHLRVRGEWFRFTSELREAARPHLKTTSLRKFRKAQRETEVVQQMMAARLGTPS